MEKVKNFINKKKIKRFIFYHVVFFALIIALYFVLKYIVFSQMLLTSYLINMIIVAMYYKADRDNDSILKIVISGIWLIAPINILILFFGEWLSTMISSLLSGLLPESLQWIGPQIFIYLIHIVLLLTANIVYRAVFVDNTIMGKNKGEKELKNFFGHNYNNYLVNRGILKNALTTELNNIDNATNWERSKYTPLEADVERRDVNNKIVKKTDNLKKALQETPKGIDNTIYLVIGSPGSGKSVSLRDLCRELLMEIEETGKIPLYINMKEWDFNVDELKKEVIDRHIRDSLKKLTTDPSAKAFINSYYNALLERGRIFFVFDSFDEIPCIMNEKNPIKMDEIIDKLSEILFDYFDENKSSGIVASRQTNHPSFFFKSHVTLYIKPFDEEKIELFFKRHEIHMILRKELFKKRKDLVYLSKNPLYASLLAYYLKEENRKWIPGKDISFPENQGEIFYSFLENRFKSSLIDYIGQCDESERDEYESINIGDLFNVASEISYYMYKNELGLEVSYDSIMTSFYEIPRIEKIINILYMSGIFRNDKSAIITFVHRRFHEYFLVYSSNTHDLLVEEGVYEKANIRDALVLYCEVAKNEEMIKNIATNCWEIIKKCDDFGNILKDDCREAIRAMLFLSEAFVRRKEFLKEYIDELGEFVSNRIRKRYTDLICIESFVDTIVLYENDILDEILKKFFALDITWLKRLVLNRCYYLNEYRKSVKGNICRYISSLGYGDFIFNFSAMDFIFKSSYKYLFIRTYLYMKTVDLLLLPIAFCVVSLNALSPNYFNAEEITVIFIGNLIIILCMGLLLNLFLKQDLKICLIRILVCLIAILPFITGEVESFVSSISVASLCLIPIYSYWSFLWHTLYGICWISAGIIMGSSMVLIELLTCIPVLVVKMINLIKKFIFNKDRKKSIRIAKFIVVVSITLTISLYCFDYYFPIEANYIAASAQSQADIFVENVRGFLETSAERPIDEIGNNSSDKTENSNTNNATYNNGDNSSDYTGNKTIVRTNNYLTAPNIVKLASWCTVIVFSVFCGIKLFAFANQMRLYYFVDFRQIRNIYQKNVEEAQYLLKRTEFESIIESLKSKKGVQFILSDALQNKMKLTGNWKGNRPYIEDNEQANKDLMELDKRNLPRS